MDDSRAIQAIVRRVVENCQYPNAEIRVASNGQEALDVLNTFKPRPADHRLAHAQGVGPGLLQTMRQSGMTDIQVGFITTESSETCSMRPAPTAPHSSSTSPSATTS